MKIIQFFQKNLLLIYGIGLHQNPFNWKILVAFFVFCASIFSCSAYFVNEAKTFQDYANSTCVCTAQIGVAILFVCFASNMQQCFGYIDEAEQIIEDSKFGNQLSTAIPCFPNKFIFSGWISLIFFKHFGLN